MIAKLRITTYINVLRCPGGAVGAKTPDGPLERRKPKGRAAGPQSQARAVDTAAEHLLLTAANSSRLGVLGRKRGDFFSYAKQALQYPDFACVSLRSILWRTRTELKCDPGACRLIITRAAAVATASAQLPSFLPWSGQSVQTSFDGEMCCSLWVVFSG